MNENVVEPAVTPETHIPQEISTTLDQESGERVQISSESAAEPQPASSSIQRDSETGEQESS